MNTKPALLKFLTAAFAAILTTSGMAAPNVTATKDDNTAPGVRKNVGNNIDYTVNIANTGDATATGVVLTDPTPANTTLIASSLNATPVAIDDTYPATVIANTSINTATSGFSVVTNDFAGYSGGAAVANTALTITAFDAATTGGGTVSMTTTGANVGQFTYTPAPGFTGTDTFTYTISNGVAGGTAASIKATVSITVGGPVVWFVNPNLGSNGNGTLASPFNNLASAVSAVGANTSHRIFIYSGGGNQGAITLNSGGWLVGQAVTGASFDAVMAITYPADTVQARPTINNASRPVLSGSSGTVITLGSGNTVEGVNVTNSNGNGITGSAVGTLAFADFDVTVTGGTALSVTTSGTVTATGTNTLNSTNNTALNVVSVNIGAVGMTFKSISSGASANAGIVLDNTGTSGGLTVTGTPSTAGSGGTISGKTGTDLVPGGGVFPTNIVGTQGTGIFLRSTSNPSFNGMTMSNFSNFGIYGTSVTGFSFTNSTITGTNGTTEAGSQEEGAIRFDGLFTSASFPTAQITGSTIQGGYSVNIRVQNTTGTLNRLLIDNCTLGPVDPSTTHGGSSVLYDAASGATFNWTVSNSSFTASRSHMLIGTGHGGSHMDAIVSTNNFVNGATNILSIVPGILSGAAGIVLQGGDLGAADVTFNITGNNISTPAGARGAAINIYKATNATSGTFDGTIASNNIGVVGQPLSGASNSAPGIWIQDHGAGTFNTLIQNNIIVEYGEEAIDLQGTGTPADHRTSTLNASIFGNVATPNAANAFCGLYIEQGAVTGDGGTMNIVVGNATGGSPQRNDFSNGDPGNGSDIEIIRAGMSNTVLNLSKNGSAAAGGANPTGAQIAQVLQDDNIGGAATSFTDASPGNRNLVTTLPTLPTHLMYAEGGIERAKAADVPGSARAPRAVFGASPKTSDIAGATDAIRRQDISGGAPETARAARALPDAASPLTQAQLDTIVAAAFGRWKATGLTAEQLATLRSLKFEVADLPGTYLGEANGTRIRVDNNAGGNGWHVDASTEGDALFGTVVSPTRRYTDPASAPAGRIDLLTVVLHEMGHSLGLDDSYLQQDRDSLMYGFLTKGERRLPSANQALGAVPHADGVTHFLAAPLNIGDLPAGKSVVITFSVTITGTVASISNQGTVTYTGNPGGVLTDDPGAGGAADPTVTPVEVPPTVSNVVKSVNEDVATAFAAGDFTPGSYSDGNGDPLATVRITSLPANGVLKLSGSTFSVPQDIAIANIGNLTYTSNQDYNGPDSFGWNGSDGTLFAATGATVNVTVNAVNDKPTFTAVDPPAVYKNAGAQSVVGWATFNPGPANESGQTVLAYNVTNVSNPGLFSAGPSVATNGTLTYTPSGTSSGTSTFQVTVQDSGGTSPGVDTSDAQTFTITINAPPDSSLSALTVSAGTLSFSSGTTDYSITYPYATPYVSVTPTVSDPAAKVKVNGTSVTSGTASGIILIPQGTTPDLIKVVVTASDLVTTTTYKISVKRPISANAYLYSLKANVVGFTPDITTLGALSPAFLRTTAGYSLNVGNTVSSITVTPILSHNFASVTVAGNPVASGTASGSIPLSVGTNPIAVVVTAEDGTTQMTYTLTVRRNPVTTGSYDGLAVPLPGAATPQTDVGLGTLTIGPGNGFSGKFTLGGSATPVAFTGVFDADGVGRFGPANATAMALVRAGFPTLTLAMHLDVQLPLTSQVIGTLSQGPTLVSNIALNRRLYTSAPNPAAPLMNVPLSLLNPATDMGNYTAIFQALTPAAQGLAASAYPQGDGWANVYVRDTGIVYVSGELADGQPFTYSNYLSKDNVLPFYVPMYSNAGSVSGPVQFRNVPGQSDADDIGMLWFKPVNLADTAYVNGWPNGIKVDFLGSKQVRPYLMPGKTPLGNNAASAPTVNAVLTVSDGGLASSLSNQLSIAASGAVHEDAPTGPSAQSLAVTVTGPGSLSGSFAFPVTGTTTQFKGVVFQKLNRAAGYFLAPAGGTTQESGAVTITAQ